jgi:hypothetical protein
MWAVWAILEQPEQLVQLALQVPQVQVEFKAIKDLQVQLAHQVYKDQMEPLVQAPQVQVVLQVPQAHRAYRELWVPLEFKVTKVLLD